MSFSKFFKERLHIIFVPGTMKQVKIKTSVPAFAGFAVIVFLMILAAGYTLVKQYDYRLTRAENQM